MKILISSDGPHAHYYIRTSWAKVFANSGHQVKMWEINQESAFDIFDDFEPDLFMGQTYNLNNALFKCIKERPHMKVVLRASDWGEMQDDIDLVKYPILVAQEEEKKLLEKLSSKPENQILFIIITMTIGLIERMANGTT